MSDHDQDQLTDDGTGSARSIRRTQAIVGGTALAIALGVGGFLLSNRHAERLTSAPTPAPVGKAIAPSPSGVADSAGTAQADSTGLFGPVRPSPAPSVSASSLADRLADARSANHRLGTEVRPPAPPKSARPPVDPSKLHIVESGSLTTDHKTLRVVSAPLDLTGQRELAWVADGGEPYGDADCTQKIKMSNNPTAAVRPTLLICWRVSATRSAYTVAVDLSQHPSKADSVAALDQAWAKLS